MLNEPNVLIASLGWGEMILLSVFIALGWLAVALVLDIRGTKFTLNGLYGIVLLAAGALGVWVGVQIGAEKSSMEAILWVALGGFGGALVAFLTFVLVPMATVGAFFSVAFIVPIYGAQLLRNLWDATAGGFW